MFFPPCTQSAADTAPHGARANFGRTRRIAPSTQANIGFPRTKNVSAHLPLFFRAARARGAEISRVAFKR